MPLLHLVSHQLISDNLFLPPDCHYLVDCFRNQSLHCDVDGFLAAICHLTQHTNSQTLNLWNVIDRKVLNHFQSYIK